MKCPKDADQMRKSAIKQIEELANTKFDCLIKLQKKIDKIAKENNLVEYRNAILEQKSLREDRRALSRTLGLIQETE